MIYTHYCSYYQSSHAFISRTMVLNVSKMRIYNEPLSLKCLWEESIQTSPWTKCDSRIQQNKQRLLVYSWGISNVYNMGKKKLDLFRLKANDMVKTDPKHPVNRSGGRQEVNYDLKWQRMSGQTVAKAENEKYLHAGSKVPKLSWTGNILLDFTSP